MSRACFSQAVLRANVGTSMIWKTGSRFPKKSCSRRKKPTKNWSSTIGVEQDEEPGFCRVDFNRFRHL
jgi:hypothetical protein